MKSINLLLPLASSLLILASCNGGGSANQSFHVATFHLNYETGNEIYTSIVVKKDANLAKPADPIREGYLFANWTADQANQTVFSGFDAPLSANIDLYASWTPISEADDLTKLNMLIEAISSASAEANHAYAKQTQADYYPQYQDTPTTYYQEKDLTRYKDITVAKYYESDETSSPLLAEQQYFYDDTSFYRILKDYTDDSNSSKTAAKFDESQVNAFLNVDFMNLYGADLKGLSQLLSNPEKVRVPYGDDGSSSDEEEFVGDYSANIEFDPTAFSVSKESYSFAVAYETYQYSTQSGWVTQSYSTTATIGFLNGKINRAIVQMSYSFALSEGPYYINISSETCSWGYGEYAEFGGTRFNPADFTEKSN